MPKGKAKVGSANIHEIAERGRNDLSPHCGVTNCMLINEDPVLNSAVSVLGQSLDILGDFKSFLMDSKLLPHNGEDNEAQAGQYALAA